jgi:hypothetical protein
LGKRGSLAEKIHPGFERLEAQREVEVFGGEIVLAHVEDGFFRAVAKGYPYGLGNKRSSDSLAPEFRMDHDRGDVGEIALPLDHGSGYSLSFCLGYEKFEAGFSANALERVKEPVEGEISSISGLGLAQKG